MCLMYLICSDMHSWPLRQSLLLIKWHSSGFNHQSFSMLAFIAGECTYWTWSIKICFEMPPCFHCVAATYLFQRCQSVYLIKYVQIEGLKQAKSNQNNRHTSCLTQPHKTEFREGTEKHLMMAGIVCISIFFKFLFFFFFFSFSFFFFPFFSCRSNVAF